MYINIINFFFFNFFSYFNYLNFSIKNFNLFYFKNQKSLNFFFFLFYSLNYFFKKKIKKNFLLFFKNYKTQKQTSLLSTFIQINFKKLFINQQHWLSFLNFIEFLFQSLNSKDALFFLRNLKHFFFFLSFFLLKKFLSLIIFFFNFLKPWYTLNFSILGIYFSIRGKLGLKGGLKKKRLLYKFKKTSFSEKKIKINFAQDTLQTYVGSIGLNFFIFY